MHWAQAIQRTLQSQPLWMAARNKFSLHYSLLVMIFITFLLSWLSDFQHRVHVDLWRRRTETGRFWGTPAAVGVHTHVQSHTLIFLPKCLSPYNLLPHLLGLAWHFLPCFWLFSCLPPESFCRTLPDLCIPSATDPLATCYCTPEHSSCRGILSIQVRTWAHNWGWENGDTAFKGLNKIIL